PKRPSGWPRDPLGAAARRPKLISSASQRPSFQGDREMAITLSTSGNGFVPTSDVGNKKGLHWKKDSQSSATLNGSGLVNGLSVTILFPPNWPLPKIKWTGTTTNSNPERTQCTVNLTEVLDNDGPRDPDSDDNTTVSVTASDSTTTSNTITPTVPTGS